MKLEQLRHEMRAESIDAIIFPSSDPHGSEYVAPHWRVREWISGFTGSAGTAVVTLDEAALWTDSRYFLQAERQLSSSWTLMKDGLADTPSITDWLLRKLSSANGRVVAVDGMVMNYSEVTALQTALRRIGVSVRTNYDAACMLWKDRPALPKSEIYAIPETEAGESVTSKLNRIREVMRQEHCDAHVVTDLMSIAWTLNLRGNDVPMTPVFISYLVITLDDATLCCNGYLTNEAQKQLRDAGVKVSSYLSPLTSNLSPLTFDLRPSTSRILIDPDTANYTLYNKVKEQAVASPSPIISFKAVKNETELAGFRQAMLYDGVAMVRFLRWLIPAVEAGGETEISVSNKLEALRRENPHCLDLSFGTISGYNAHGAIVHYSATPETDAPLRPEGLLLVDSGAQYDCGTTDITRTIALGPLTDEMKRAYTYVLKANIALATCQFPDGINGTQVDAIARSEVWQGGYNYLHGTGHGVGWRLCVHEGPHAIRLDWRPAPLHAGMVVTDEPGIYLEGKFGIRTENMMEVVNVNGNFIKLHPLTLCPIDMTPIEWSMLRADEVAWLNDYHQHVRESLLPLLTDEGDRQWLIDSTPTMA